MNLGEQMEIIAEEAERQGFVVRQTRQGTWRFSRKGNEYVVNVRDGRDVLAALRMLISAGLDWTLGD